MPTHKLFARTLRRPVLRLTAFCALALTAAVFLFFPAEGRRLERLRGLASRLAGFGGPSPVHPGGPPPAAPPGYTLVFSDEFDGANSSAPDPQKWVHDIGGWGWGNNELQTYTNRTENSYQENGHLVIKALKETFTGPDGITRDYTSARLKTQGKFEQQYGRYEARIKVPFGQGLWPAFWMLGNNIDSVGWPVCGEIDIMEHIGRIPATAYGTIHGPGFSGAAGIQGVYNLPDGQFFADDFHVFAVEWDPHAVRWYIDGNLYKTVTPSSLPANSSWVFEHPFFMLLNVAVGGDWPGSPDATTVFPQTMLVDYVRVYERTGNPPNAWVSKGPEGGVINALVADPANANTLYAAVRFAGVYKSTDGGATWARRNDGLTELDVQSIAVSQAVPGTIYAGTGGYAGAVFKSTNGGASWAKANTTALPQAVLSLAVSPGGSSTLYAGTLGGGVYKSTDGGVTWATANTGLTNLNIQSLAVKPDAASTIYAGTENGLFKSTDAGANWSAVNTGLNAFFINFLTFDPNSTGSIYACTTDGVYRSTNGGANWTKLDNGYPATWVNALAVTPGNSNVIYAGGHTGVFKSADGGASWSPSNSGINASFINAIVVSAAQANTVWAGTEGAGVFKSTNAGAAWARSNTNIKAAQVNHLAVVPGPPKTIYAALYGGLQKSTDGGATWTPIDNGILHHHVSDLAIPPSAPSTLYATTYGGGVFKTTDGGATWALMTAGQTHPFVNDIALDPNNANVVYIGTQNQGMYKSTDGGSTWQQINSGLPADAIIGDIAVHPTNTSTVYIGVIGAGIFKSTNGGATWAAANTGLNHSQTNALLIDPANPAKIYAGINGGPFYKTTNGGDSWQLMSDCLSGTDLYSLALKPGSADTIYAGTNGGVNLSVNGGQKWKPLQAGLPQGLPGAWALTLAVDPDDPNLIYAGTMAGSVFCLRTDGNECAPPPIFFQPADVTLCGAGQPAMFSVTTPEDSCRSFQWRRNGAPLSDGGKISGAQSAVLTINNADAGDAASYDVVLTNACGTTTSRAAALAVNTPAAVTTHPLNQTALVGGSVTFTAAASGSPAPTVRWEYSPDGGANYLSLPATSTSFNLTNLVAVQNGWRFRAVFTNPCSEVMTNPALLTVRSGAVTGTDIWTTNGPYGGLMSALAIDPASPNTVYVTGEGVFKTTDGGTNWAPTNGCDFPAPRSVAVDPTDTRNVYLGNFAGFVSKSTNGGASWRSISAGLPPKTVTALVIDPANPATLYAGLHDGGVYKSTDAGESWAASNTGLTGPDIFSLVLHPTNPQILYAGDARGGGVYKSTDGGATWAAVNTGLTSGQVFSLAVSASSPNTLYAGVSGVGVFRTMDGGANWAKFNTTLQSLDIRGLAVDPADANLVYAATNVGVFKSADGAASWTNTSSGLTKLNVFKLAIHPTNAQIIFAATHGGGVFKTTDGGANWCEVNQGLSGTDVLSMAAAPGNPGVIYAGVYEGGVFRSLDRGFSWQQVNQGLTNFLSLSVAVDPNNPATLYTGNEHGLFKSTNSGVVWTQTGLTQGSIHAVAVTPGNSGVIYAGTHDRGVLKSTNGGASWSQVNNGLTANWVRALLINPNSPATVYAATETGGVFKTTDGGANWAQVNNGLTSTAIAALAFAPGNPQTVYAAGNQLFKSVDGGANWTNVGAGIPYSIRSVLVDPNDTSTIYAGTHGGGIYRSLDGGATWAGFSAGLDVGVVKVLLAEPTGGGLYAGTTGGVYTLKAGGTTCAPPVIGTQPTAQAVCLNAPATFSVAATGTGLSYQWLKGGVPLADGGNYAGTRTPVLTINAATAADAGDYEMLVTGACGQTASCPAPLTIVGPPMITQQPLGASLCPNASHLFTVGATSGLPLTYQWRKDGVPLPGATGASLAVVAGPTAVGSYDVVVSNGCESVTSQVAGLSLKLQVTANPISQTAVAKSQVVFTAAAAGSPAPSVQWQISTNGGGSYFNLNGATSPSFGLAGNGLTTAQNGWRFRAVFTNACGQVTSDAAILTVTKAPTTTTLTSLPNPSAVGQLVTLQAAVAPGDATGSVQFFDGATSLGTAPVTGGVATLVTSVIAPGLRALRAVYAGDANYLGSEGGRQHEVVNTAVGQNVTVSPQTGLTLSFQNVTQAGTTAAAAMTVEEAELPHGYFLAEPPLAFDITTTASYSGSIVVTFTVAGLTDPAAFADLRILHREGNVWVDRTILSPDAPAPDFAAKTVSARVTSLSPFVLAQFGNVPVGVSSQKAGSVLVFPYYTSDPTGNFTNSDTLLQITNVSNGAARAATGAPAYQYLHLFFINDSCSPADTFLCLTPNGSVQIRASEYDPMTTGYLVAVAVNAEGVPIQNNSFVGSAFVRDNTGGVIDGYSAEAYWKSRAGPAAVSGQQATLVFDGDDYDCVARQFVVPVQDPARSEQTLVLASLSGDLGTRLAPTAQDGVGLVYRDDEQPASYQTSFGGCLVRAPVTNSTFRVSPGSLTTLLKDRSGYLKFQVRVPAAGLLFARQGAGGGNRFAGIRALHSVTMTKTVLTLPVFPPACR